jgi:hypothetical protein
MKRTLTMKITLASAAGALALGAAACEVEENGADTTTDDELLDDGSEEGL